MSHIHIMEKQIVWLERQVEAQQRTIDSLQRECADRDGYRRDRDDSRIHEARVAIAQRLLDETERARREESALNSAHPVTADRFSQVLDTD